MQTDPPPDLAVEVDYTSHSLDKLQIYASLRVPEFRRYEKQRLYVYPLAEGQYNLCDQNFAFPALPIAEIPGFIEQSKTFGQRATVRLFKAIIRDILQNYDLG